jgi:O-antigen/teichoic acid export membrane protein
MKSNSYWAIADQGIASAGNFATTLLLARALPPAEFGTFVLLNSACVVVLGFQGNLVSIPMVVLRASESTSRTNKHLSSALILTAFLMPISALVLLPAAASLHRLGTGMLALIFVLAWQLQETTRRALISSFRYRDAIWGDAISYVGQALLVGYLYLGKHTSLDRAYVFMAFTSLVAVALQSWQVGLARTTWSELWDSGLRFWNLGKWLAVVSLLGVAEGPISPWLLNWFHGIESAARFQAVMSVWGLAHPITSSIPAIVIPATANLLQKSEKRNGKALIELGSKYSLEYGLILAPLFIVLALWPHNILMLFYGRTSVYVTETLAMRIGIIVIIITVPMMVFDAILTGAGRTKTTASMHGAGAVASLVSSPPLIYSGGVCGAMLVEVVSRGARFLWAVRALRFASFDFNGENNKPRDYAPSTKSF